MGSLAVSALESPPLPAPLGTSAWPSSIQLSLCTVEPRRPAWGPPSPRGHVQCWPLRLRPSVVMPHVVSLPVLSWPGWQTRNSGAQCRQTRVGPESREARLPEERVAVEPQSRGLEPGGEPAKVCCPPAGPAAEDAGSGGRQPRMRVECAASLLAVWSWAGLVTSAGLRPCTRERA